MFSWLLRGLVMAAVHIVARVVLAMAIVQSPLNSLWWKTIAVSVVVLIPLLWGGLDGIIDGRAHDDPDDYKDLTVRWLKAGVLAGLISCVVCYFLSHYALNGMGENNIFVEVFAGGSFTALLIFVPAFVGAAAGRFLTRRGRRSKSSSDDRESREYADA